MHACCIPSHAVGPEPSVSGGFASTACSLAKTRRSRHCRPFQRLVAFAAESSSDSGYDPTVIQATDAYTKGLQQGIDGEDLVAQVLRASDKSSLTPVQEVYKDKVKAKLAEKAQELATQHAEGTEEFELGQKLYERGKYQAAEQQLEAALATAGEFTTLGGDIQMWLALAYSANGREDACVAMYKSMAEQHPNPRVRRQAKDLCFIMEAPKMLRNSDEKVSIPVMDLDPNFGGKKGVRRPPNVKSVPKVKKSMEDEFWENYRPPSYLRNKYVWAAAVTLGICLAAYSFVL